MSREFDLPDPEGIADKTLEASGQSKPPLDFDPITRLWPGLEVTEEALEEDGYLIDLGSRGAEIFVTSRRPKGRQRYTVAHELGHWVLARECNLGLAALQKKPAIERWCDVFAASLLMPRQWVLSELSSSSARVLPTIVMSGHSRYGVTRRAWRYRLAEVGSISTFEVRVARSGDLLRVDRSESKQLPEVATQDMLSKVLEKIRRGVPDLLQSDGTLTSIRRLIRSVPDEKTWLICVFSTEQGLIQPPPPLEPFPLGFRHGAP